MYGYRLGVSILVVHPHDHVAEEELWLPLPSTTKMHVQNLKSGFCRMHYYCFHIIVKSKSHKLSHKSGPAVMILVIWEARSRTQSPEYSAVLFYITAVYTVHFSQMPILIRNRSFKVFSNLNILLHSSLLGSLYVNSTLFSFQFSVF